MSTCANRIAFMEAQRVMTANFIFIARSRGGRIKNTDQAVLLIIPLPLISHQTVIDSSSNSNIDLHHIPFSHHRLPSRPSRHPQSSTYKQSHWITKSDVRSHYRCCSRGRRRYRPPDWSRRLVPVTDRWLSIKRKGVLVFSVPDGLPPGVFGFSPRHGCFNIFMRP